eukprot:CAMPEP_0173379366 /NCGR_PEP_ID=MMETSP1356-20130122/2345_1 /TAXON_ID=77927 ORGANISM="Hemiselmis virescens, Strain PCC157" /NCGR_SAMPLE_ID=MMETSP1356 /ASSEMBLY_ACC=CAM_ASM_000847 /LENGTH=174 /DNA_ID=CAMNT_0014332691 /DNA_START=8 /DNA_END=532 /DNA_ORIENTATION=-
MVAGDIVAPRRSNDTNTWWRRLASVGLATVALAGAAAVVASSSGPARAEMLAAPRAATGMVIEDHGAVYAYKRVALRQAALRTIDQMPNAGAVPPTQSLAHKNSAADFFGEGRTGSGMTHVEYEPYNTVDYGLVPALSKDQETEIINYVAKHTDNDGKLDSSKGAGVMEYIPNA